MQMESNDACAVASGEDHRDCLCPIGGLLDMLSRKWSLQILTHLGNAAATRFNQLQKKLARISPRTLTDRLKELEGAGLIRRVVFPEIPPRVEYALTRDGQELRTLMIPLMRWVAGR